MSAVENENKIHHAEVSAAHKRQPLPNWIMANECYIRKKSLTVHVAIESYVFVASSPLDCAGC